MIQLTPSLWKMAVPLSANVGAAVQCCDPGCTKASAWAVHPKIPEPGLYRLTFCDEHVGELPDELNPLPAAYRKDNHGKDD